LNFTVFPSTTSSAGSGAALSHIMAFMYYLQDIFLDPGLENQTWNGCDDILEHPKPCALPLYGVVWRYRSGAVVGRRLAWPGPAPAWLAPLAHHATGANATPLTGYAPGPDPWRPRHRLALRHSPPPPLSSCACSVHRFSRPSLLQHAAPRSRMRLIAMIPRKRDPRKNARSLSQTLRL
jgi:hypothetical protein